MRRVARRSAVRGRWTCLVACAAGCLLACAGCGERIDTVYGQRSGPGASLSVNGTAVLADLFEQAGHRVHSRYALSPGLWERADCIVWFPDDFLPPSEEVRVWLEEWLQDESGRTLIYVGRDFDAAPFYWNSAEGTAPAEQQAEIRRRKNEAAAAFTAARQQIPASEICDWFTYGGSPSARKVGSLEGAPEWLEGVDPSQVEIELGCRLIPPEEAEVLLSSQGDALVTVQRAEESQLIVVTNGSFLLNLPLVNHEHRKLADKLIQQVGRPGQTVVFLESRTGGPPIRDADRTPGPPTGLEIFHIWPTNWILLHLAVAGILFAFSRYPIFGRPRQPEPEGVSDFGKHVQALADLFQSSRDSGYAMSRVLHYQQIAHSERKDER